MNSDIARIRRERWLKFKQIQQDDGTNSETESNKSLVSLSANNNETNDDSTTSFAQRENDKAMGGQKREASSFQTSNTKRKQINNGGRGRNCSSTHSSGQASDCIDLTLSDEENVADDSNGDDDDSETVCDDADIVIVSSRSSKKRPHQMVTSGSRKKRIKTAEPAASELFTKPLSSASKIATTIKKKPELIKNSFSVCSYNIWFGEAHQSQRMMRISEIISELAPRPTFFGLQEATPELMSDLSPLLRSMGYSIMRQEGVAYGCALGILTTNTEGSSVPSNHRSPSIARVVDSGFEPYQQTMMGRGLLWVHANVDTVGDILFATTHLESFVPGNDGSQNRELQIQQASQFLLKKMKTSCSSSSSSSSSSNSINGAIITGDLNWDDERKRSTGNDKNLLSIINNSRQEYGDRKWSDAWLTARPGEDGYTYDSKVNQMLRGNLRRRFDRCLVHFPPAEISDKLSIHSAKLVGKEIIEGVTWKKEVQQWKNGRPSDKFTYQERPLAPSDHFGLVVTLGDPSKVPRPIVESKPTPKRRKK